MLYPSRFSLTLLVGLLISIGTFAQQDSLKAQLDLELADSTRSKVLYLLSLEFDRSNPTLSREFAVDALELLNELPEDRSKGKAMCYKVIGNTFKNQGEYDQALANYMEVVKWTEMSGNQSDLAPVYNDIGVVYKLLKQYDKALPYYKRSNKVCREVGNQKGVVMTLNNIGTIYAALGKRDSAKAFYLEALEISKLIENYRAMAIATNNLGELYAHDKNYTDAIRYFMETLSYDRKTNDRYGMTYSLLNIGNAFREMGVYANMELYFDSTLVLAKAMDLKDIIKGVYRSYSLFHEQQEDYENAHRYFQLYTQVKDSIYDEQRMSKFAELETKYDTEKKEREISELSAKQAQDALALAQQRNWIIGLIAMVLITLMGGWVIIDRRRKKAQEVLAAERLQFQKKMLDSTVLAQGEERQRIAKDLHDGLVQSLAALKLGVQNSMNVAGLTAEQKGSFSEHIKNIDTAAEEARNISHQMMPRALTETGLISAFEDMLSKTLKQTDIGYNFEQFGVLNQRFKPSIEIGLYRIAQELVNNILKHSGAKHVDIQLLKTKTHLVLHVEDDGKGFEFDKKGSQNGIGLNNIFSRASSVNGEVNYEKGKPGTIANIRVPLED